MEGAECLLRALLALSASFVVPRRTTIPPRGCSLFPRASMPAKESGRGNWEPVCGGIGGVIGHPPWGNRAAPSATSLSSDSLVGL